MPPQLEQAIAQLEAWTREEHPPHIVRNWVFDSFQTAVAFFVKLSELAERLDHHPEVLSSFRRIQVRLWTHDTGGLTHKDVELAGEIDRLLKREFSGRYA